jgi:hypothetical protein
MKTGNSLSGSAIWPKRQIYLFSTMHGILTGFVALGWLEVSAVKAGQTPDYTILLLTEEIVAYIKSFPNSLIKAKRGYATSAPSSKALKDKTKIDGNADSQHLNEKVVEHVDPLPFFHNVQYHTNLHKVFQPLQTHVHKTRQD